MIKAIDISKVYINETDKLNNMYYYYYIYNLNLVHQ